MNTGKLSILGAIELLCKDQAAKLYPHHPDFNYERTGRRDSVKPGYPQFIPNPSMGCSITGTTWHGTKLNVSVTTKMTGTVSLGQDAVKIGLPDVWPVHLYRSYTVIKNGARNVQKLYISTSDETRAKFAAIGAAGEQDTNGVYALLLDKLSVAGEVQRPINAEELCQEAIVELEMMCRLKVLNHFLNKTLSKTAAGAVYTPEQDEFLSSKGVARGVYSPPTEKGESVPEINCREFDIKIKGYSTLPKVDDVISKIADKKAINGPAAMMSMALDDWSRIANNNDEQQGMIELSAAIDAASDALSTARNKLHVGKFNVLFGDTEAVGGKFIDGTKVMIDGFECTFAIK